MLESLGKVSQGLPTRLRWRIFSIWAPRWRLGESLCSFPKSQRRQPDLLHLPVDAQQRNYKKVWWWVFLARRSVKKGDKTLAMFEGTHAIVYCATGSHGMWPDTGRHEYLKLSNGYTLVDQASSGTSWYTWEYLKPVQYDPSGQYSGDFKFLGFQGHWGDKKHNCGIVNNIQELFGECWVNNGPQGLSGFPFW